ncbi:MAG TPA: molybdopterin-dependent oxidoreductase, partial [Planctomycetota bacterium]|nr:molybdopterin-dependent oxidoreductase [Planctomycetota bacterium]
MTSSHSNEPYRGPAGGWGALAASARHLLRDKAVKRGGRALLDVNQIDGFDCPGCAWPEGGERSRFEFCENGVKAVSFEATSLKVGPEFFAKHSVTELLEQTDHWLESQGRLTHPMRYDASTDRYVPVSWEAAFDEIGRALRTLPDPNEAVFYTSGRTSNEAAFLYQLFGRLLGTNNFPDCSNLCHESSGVALSQSIGIGKGSVTLEDFRHADAIFVIGQNPGTNHPRMLSELQAASRRGAKIVAINPLRERGLEEFIHPQDVKAMLTGSRTRMSTLYLQPIIGGDLALLVGLSKAVLEEDVRRGGGVLDREFIRDHTSGFDDFRAIVDATDWRTIEEESGLAKEKIEEAARVYIDAERVICCWAMGLTQHKHAVPTIQAIVNWLLLRGNIGRQGAGVCPVRGHSNVQGDRTVGITS